MAAATIFSNLLVGGALAAACWSAGAAQTVYRCGPQGNLYSQQPCEAGKAVNVADPRSAEQLAQARKAGAEQRQLALQMARDRRDNERAMRPPLAGGIDFKRASEPAPSLTKPRKPKTKSHSGKTATPASQQDFVAIEPGSGKKKRKKTQD